MESKEGLYLINFIFTLFSSIFISIQVISIYKNINLNDIIALIMFSIAFGMGCINLLNLGIKFKK